MLPDIAADVASALTVFGEKLSAGGISTGSTNPPPMIEADETEFAHAIDPIGEVTVSFTRGRG